MNSTDHQEEGVGFRMTEIRIESVRVVGRHRKDLGDIGQLAESIKELGLLNPITITPDGVLIAGQRRLEAFRRLGLDTIPARIADSLDAAAEKLRAERDENTARKPMTPEELVSLGRALERLEQPRAKERLRKAQERGRAARSGLSSPEDSPTGEHRTTDEVVAEAVGMSKTGYYRARSVVAAANDPDLTDEERQVARAALEEMNATGNLTGPYNRVRSLRKPQPDRPAAKRPSQQPNQLRTPAGQRKALDGALVALAGLAHGLKQVDPIHPEISRDEAARWESGLVEARHTISSLIRRLKEFTNAETTA